MSEYKYNWWDMLMCVMSRATWWSWLPIRAAWEESSGLALLCFQRGTWARRRTRRLGSRWTCWTRAGSTWEWPAWRDRAGTAISGKGHWHKPVAAQAGWVFTTFLFMLWTSFNHVVTSWRTIYCSILVLLTDKLNSTRFVVDFLELRFKTFPIILLHDVNKSVFSSLSKWMKSL